MEDLFRGRGFDIPRMLEHLRRVAAEVGLPIGDRRRTCNSVKAQELMKWADSRGRGEPFREGAYAAYFVHGRNLGLEDVLASVADEAGLSAAEARETLRSGAYATQVNADWARARALGVNAVPTLVVGGQTLAGYRPYEVLAKFAESAGAKRRSRA